MSARGGGPGDPDDAKKALAAAKTPEDAAEDTFGFARAACHARRHGRPNPKNPPLYLDLPTKDGVPQPDVVAKWAANAPLAFVDQYIGNLKQYHAIAMDVGDQDGLRVDAGKLHDILDNYGIANSLRNLFRHAYQRGGRPLSEPRDAVLRQESLLPARTASKNTSYFLAQIPSDRSLAVAARKGVVAIVELNYRAPTAREGFSASYSPLPSRARQQAGPAPTRRPPRKHEIHPTLFRIFSRPAFSAND